MSNKVLIVEDNESFASTLIDVCDLSGVSAIALGPKAALMELKGHNNYCCIILDLHMPEMNGRDFIQYLCNQINRTDIPLILVSGYQLNKLREVANFAKSLGFKYVQELNKPIKINELTSEIRKIAGIGVSCDIAQIQNAFNNKEFHQIYQPLIDLKNGNCFAVEALVRWQPKSGQHLSPAVFIPIIETSSMLEAFTIWTIEQAASQWKKWSDKGINLNVAVNLSANSLDIPMMSQHCREITSRHGMPMTSLIVEITETATFNHPPTACDCLRNLRKNDAQLAVDDFGTGYSSLKQLMELPYSEVKIDQCFTKEIIRDKTAQAIVKAIVELSHSLGYKVIAEGVETEEISACLQNLGVDYAQGYFYSKPVSADTIESYFYKNNNFVTQSLPLAAGILQ